MDCHSALKRKDIPTHGTTRMKLEDIMLSEISRSRTHKYGMIPLIWSPLSVHRDRQQNGGCQGLGEGDGELVCNGHGVSVCENEVLWREMVVTSARQSDYAECHWTVYWETAEMAKCMLRILYHNFKKRNNFLKSRFPLVIYIAHVMFSGNDTNTFFMV